MQEVFETKMAEVGDKALELIRQYFDGEADTNDIRIDRAFKFIGHPIKVMHMKQYRKMQERSQAIRLLKFLPDDKTRKQYIRMTQPQTEALLENRPKKT